MNKFKRKSQGMSINIVVVAALALIVLVVLASIFSGRVRLFSQGLDDCESKQGHCVFPTQGCSQNEGKLNAKCQYKDKTVCCIGVSDS